MRKNVYLLAGVLLIAVLLLIPSAVAFADAMATRTMPATVAPGETFDVQMETDLVNGAIEEFLPDGFTYTGNIGAPCTMIATYKAADHKIEFVYLGALPGQCTPGTFSYEMTASMTPGDYYFSGSITDSDSGNALNPVGGDTQVTVQDEQVEDVVINEFISNPDAGSECIELYNKEATAVDLTGWTIEDGTANPDGLDGLNIPANGYLALEQGTDFGFQLNNAGDMIILKKGATEVDKVTYGNWDDGNTADNAPAPGSGESTGRWPNGADTDVDNVDFMVFETPTCGAANQITVAGVEAIRTLPAGAVAPGAQFEVSVYCVGINPGGVTETLPAGFGYVNNSESPNIAQVVVNGQNVTFGWMAEPGTFTYEATASNTAGNYMFAGQAKGQGIASGTEVIAGVTGDDTVTVQEPGAIPDVMFAQAGYNVNEGNAVVVTVVLSEPGTQTITVEYDTYDQSAVAPGDYTAVSGMLTFPPGVVTGTFSVQTVDDALVEGNEVFGVQLANPVNANLGAPNDIDITIIDDDAPADQVWDCPLAELALIAPYQNRLRPDLAATYQTANITSDTTWFTILYLNDEATQDWLIFDSRQTIANNLNELVPGEYYYVIVSEPGQLNLYQ